MGGKGGYTEASSFFNKSDLLYINVGGEGVSDCDTYFCSGGYNGGGKAGGRLENTDSVYNSMTGSGGGASHIATKSGILSSFSNDTSYILIVAGGGGGSISHRYNDSNNCWSAYGGYGGGLTSGLGTLPVLGRSTPATVATQTNAGCGYNYSTSIGCGSFGQGMDSTGGIDKGESAGAGGGWYGGGSSIYGTATGGSSYIKSTLDGSTIAGNSIMPSQNESTTMIGNIGDGYARITLVSY